MVPKLSALKWTLIYPSKFKSWSYVIAVPSFNALKIVTLFPSSPFTAVSVNAISPPSAAVFK